eukprot:tig00000367_g24465.t1
MRRVENIGAVPQPAVARPSMLNRLFRRVRYQSAAAPAAAGGQLPAQTTASPTAGQVQPPGKGRVPARQAKLLVVGPPASGKSTLAAYLSGDGDAAGVRGIAVRRWKAPGGLVVSVWDFQGEPSAVPDLPPLYAGPDCAVLLCWDLRAKADPPAGAGLSAWIHAVQVWAPGAEVLVACTHADEPDARNPDEEGLAASLGGATAVICDSASGRGLEALALQAVATAARLPSASEGVPPSWTRLARRAASLRVAHPGPMSLGDFGAWAARGWRSPAAVELPAALAALHRWGALLHLRERGLVCPHPGWLADVSAEVRRAETAACRGWLHHAALEALCPHPFGANLPALAHVRAPQPSAVLEAAWCPPSSPPPRWPGTPSSPASTPPAPPRPPPAASSACPSPPLAPPRVALAASGPVSPSDEGAPCLWAGGALASHRSALALLAASEAGGCSLAVSLWGPAPDAPRLLRLLRAAVRAAGDEHGGLPCAEVGLCVLCAREWPVAEWRGLPGPHEPPRADRDSGVCPACSSSEGAQRAGGAVFLVDLPDGGTASATEQAPGDGA